MTSQVFDPTSQDFEPENNLETLLQAAAKNPSFTGAFYKTLLKSEIYILTPDAPMQPGQRRQLKYEERLNVASVEYQGMQWHPAFTSKARIAAYLKEPETCFGAPAGEIFKLLPKSNFWLNPLSACQKPIPAAEVELLLSGKIFDVIKAKAKKA